MQIKKKIEKGINIFQNRGIFGWRKRLAPAGSILPNSFINEIEIFWKQYRDSFK